MQNGSSKDLVIGAILHEALRISEARRQILQSLKHALEMGRNDEALRYARELCGIPEDDDEGYCASESKHRRPSG